MKILKIESLDVNIIFMHGDKFSCNFINCNKSDFVIDIGQKQCSIFQKKEVNTGKLPFDDEAAPKIEVSCPPDTEDLDIDCNYGILDIKDFSFKAIKLKIVGADLHLHNLIINRFDLIGEKSIVDITNMKIDGSCNIISIDSDVVLTNCVDEDNGYQINSYGCNVSIFGEKPESSYITKEKAVFKAICKSGTYKII